MTETPTCSVVVPVGYVDDFVEQQLRALAGQTGAAPFEVVLSLNSAAPGARAGLEQAVERLGDPRFRIVDSSDQRGASHARNVGARAALADLVAFCDGDDIVESDWLGHLIAGLESYDAVGGFLDESVLATDAQRKWRAPATPGRNPEFQGVPYVVSANLAVRRSAFEAVGGFDETLIRGEDMALGLDLAAKGLSVGYVGEASVHYRHRGGVKNLVRQYVLYGRGMTQVISRHGIPRADGIEQPKGLKALKPNKSPGQTMTIYTVIRRGSMLSGRIYQMVLDRLAARRNRRQRRA
jgi:GT2 family glycosyltransferase